MTFSEKLLLLRRKKGLSQEQLAEILEVSRQSVSKWEAQQTLPEPNKIIQISEVFGVSIDQLLKDDLPVDEQSAEPVEAEAAAPAPVPGKLDVVFCTKCGRENKADSAFCGYCGNPFISFASDRPDTGEQTKTDMDLAYYKANLQMQQQFFRMKQRELEEARCKQQEMNRTVPKCPYCGSTALSGHKQGYDVSAGIGGSMLFGKLGWTIGDIGSSQVIVTCLNCGKQFKPGQRLSDIRYEKWKEKEWQIGCLVPIILIIFIVLVGILGK